VRASAYHRVMSLLILAGCVQKGTGPGQGLSQESQHRAESARPRVETLAGLPEGRPLVIAQGGKSDAVIVVSAQAGPWEKRAAEDLAHYIELMTAARLPIASAPEAVAAAIESKKPVLLVGEKALEADPSLKKSLDRVAKKDPTLRADAIVLRRDGNRVYLAGLNDDCHYYAVAELLERWGCRWYLPTEFGECIPTHPELKIGKLDYAYGPPFEVRKYWLSWLGDATGAAEFQHRNKLNNLGVPAGHALSNYVQELVPKGKSVFNIPISEEATAKHVASKIEAAFAKGQDISLGMDDGIYQSDSPKDKALQAGRWDKYFMVPCMTDVFMTFYNNVARNLLAKYPNSKSRLGFLAYSNMTLPPEKVTLAEKPLVAYLAPIDIDPIHGMDDPRSLPRREYKEMMYKWAKVMQGRLVIYDYDQGMLVWRDIPNPSVQSIRQDIKHYRNAGILGVDTESRGAMATIFLNLYLRAQLYWNPDVDVDALQTEFYGKFYGPAAGPMAEYWGAIDKAWADTIVTEHEFFVAPAIYTPALLRQLERHLESAEKIAAPLASKKDTTRNERLILQRMRFTRLGFTVLDAYMEMTRAAATDVDYKAAVAAGERGLAAREELTKMNGTFTTYKAIGEHGYAWWPGEVQQYRELLAFTDGTRGKLLQKLPLEWAFRRDPGDVGLGQGWASKPIDLAYWNALPNRGTIESHKDNPGNWEMLRTDLYAQAQGVLAPDYTNYNGHAWYRTDIELGTEAGGPIHIRFPGLFNECWLYANGVLVAHREQHVLWWNNDYRFEWDVDLTGKVRVGENTIALRIFNPHHMGGMFRRPFLYAPLTK